jgi:hypothetical protein
MPIRPENRDRYPRDWPQIAARIRDLAGDRCESCTVPGGALIRRAVTDDGRPIWRMADDPAFENGRCALDGTEVPDTWKDSCGYGRAVRVVLTVAHLDHQPENCADDNLRCWCQRCHNTYDAPMRRAGIKARARARLAVADLLEGGAA